MIDANIEEAQNSLDILCFPPFNLKIPEIIFTMVIAST